MNIRVSADGGIYLSNILEKEVLQVEEALHLFKLGSKNRHIAATNMNERSSRSHAVVIITLNIINRIKGEKTVSQL